MTRITGPKIRITIVGEVYATRDVNIQIDVQSVPRVGETITLTGEDRQRILIVTAVEHFYNEDSNWQEIRIRVR